MRKSSLISRFSVLMHRRGSPTDTYALLATLHATGVGLFLSGTGRTQTVCEIALAQLLLRGLPNINRMIRVSLMSESFLPQSSQIEYHLRHRLVPLRRLLSQGFQNNAVKTTRYARVHARGPLELVRLAGLASMIAQHLACTLSEGIAGERQLLGDKI